MDEKNTFHAKKTLRTLGGDFQYYSLPELEKQVGNLSRLPVTIRILLEGLLRHEDGHAVTAENIKRLATWKPKGERDEIPFFPARVLLQDFTGVPALVDLAALRSAAARMGADPKRIEPVIPVDLVVDHSVQVDVYGIPEALEDNMRIEFQRNRERYRFLKWGQQAFNGFRVIPPGVGIIHQVNLEYLARGVWITEEKGERIAYPDTLVGTDSHTPMINGLGVLGWGVGGIEAEAAMLGQPVSMLVPDVIGVRLTGTLREGMTATDLVLTLVQMLRKKGVVGKFVEFFGPGLSKIGLAERAVLSNMTPENGATVTYFPVDDETLDYLRMTGRPPERVEQVERYMKEQGLFRTDTSPDPEFTETLELNLSEVGPSLAGPKRPHDRVPLSKMKQSFRASLEAPVKERGYELPPEAINRNGKVILQGKEVEIRHGSVIIASVTSCTNTSSPALMMAAGLLAKKAVEKGLRVPPLVKTSLAPGSRVVTDYLRKAGLLDCMEKLGFHVVAYGCATCIGNSGPVSEEIARAVKENGLVACSVLSGNRNFEGRISPHAAANYLASPPLVIAFALAGRMDIDLETEPLGIGKNGEPVFLRDIWPSFEDISTAIRKHVDPEAFRREYADVREANPVWNAIEAGEGTLFEWREDSTYIQEPPFFRDLSVETPSLSDIREARVLALLGDSVTTDHISPAGSIAEKSPAGQYLIQHGVNAGDFNSYGSRRGNDRVMIRGTFANIRLKNLLVPGVEGGVTVHLPSGETLSIYDAAMRYQEEGTPLIVLAGKEYGSGSSRDWAAKGTYLLGVRAVIAESYERIHRGNLVGMGVLPLQFRTGENAESLGLTGRETYTIGGLNDSLKPGMELEIIARGRDTEKRFRAIARLDTPVEVDYYRAGGILHAFLRQMIKG